MVLSVCPNPSVDCTVEVETLKVGSTNRIDNKVITYSGKALNVAIGVARLKGDSFATGFLYNGNGAMFVHVLDDEGVKNTFVWNDGNARTNYKVVDNKSMLTELNDKGDLVTEEKQEELISIVKELSKQAKVVVMSGSLPTGVPEDYYLRLASVLPEGVKAIVDATGDRLQSAPLFREAQSRRIAGAERRDVCGYERYFKGLPETDRRRSGKRFAVARQKGGDPDGRVFRLVLQERKRGGKQYRWRRGQYGRGGRAVYGRGSGKGGASSYGGGGGYRLGHNARDEPLLLREVPRDL